MFKQARRNSLVEEGIIHVMPWSRHTPVELPVIIRELHRRSLSDIKGAPQGNGEPIIIIPGLWTGEDGVKHLKEWLQRRNYHTVVPDVDIDNSHPEDTLRRICDSIDQVHMDRGSGIKVMGTSLGGMLALVAGRRKRRVVSEMFTFSSPTSRPVRIIKEAADRLDATASRIGTGAVKKFILEATTAAADRSLKLTHFYGSRDGVIHKDTLVRNGSRMIRIEGARHSNLTSHPQVLMHLAHALRGAETEMPLAA